VLRSTFPSLTIPSLRRAPSSLLVCVGSFTSLSISLIAHRLGRYSFGIKHLETIPVLTASEVQSWRYSVEKHLDQSCFRSASSLARRGPTLESLPPFSVLLLNFLRCRDKFGGLKYDAHIPAVAVNLFLTCRMGRNFEFMYQAILVHYFHDPPWAPDSMLISALNPILLAEKELFQYTRVCACRYFLFVSWPVSAG
jgi:hypothetical protein